MGGQKSKTVKKQSPRVRAKRKAPSNKQKMMSLEEYNAKHGYNNVSDSKTSTFSGLVKALLALALMGFVCWAVYKIILVPLGESFIDALDGAASDVMGEGSASKVDPRGREYTHKWANISRYDDAEVVAKFYYEITKSSGNTYWGTGKIEGRVLNNSGKDVDYVSVEFGLYNGDTKYGSCYDNVSSLKAGGTWSFEAGCLSWREGTSVKIEDITWY